jgi:S1-C subfamily serine protease
MAASPARRRYILTLAIAAGVILVVGALLRPDRIQNAPSGISELDRVLLQKRADRRNLDNMTAYFASVASDLSAQLVYLAETGSSGLVWNSAGLVIAPKSWTAGKDVTITGAGGPLAAAPEAMAPQLAITAYQISGAAGLRPVSAVPVVLEPGQWVVAAWRNRDGRQFAPTAFAGVGSATCDDVAVSEVNMSLPLSPAMRGGGVFDLDGNLIAVVIACDSRSAAVLPDDINAALERGRQPAGRMRQHHGLAVQPLDEAARAYFNSDSGVYISDVWLGGGADKAGLEPGDLIVEAGGEPASDPDRLACLTAPPSAQGCTVQILRGGRRMAVTLVQTAKPGAAAQEPEASLGVGFPASLAGVEVGDVAPGTVADQAGIRRGDRLLQLNGRSLQDQTQAARLLSTAPRPLLLTAQRGSKKFCVLVGSPA